MARIRVAFYYLQVRAEDLRGAVTLLVVLVGPVDLLENRVIHVLTECAFDGFDVDAQTVGGDLHLVAEATRYEEARGWVVESVEQDNRGFDLISRKPHLHDAKTFTDVRFIEVKGRAGIGEIALTENEYRTAERLKGDYWLYAVFNCGSTPGLHPIRDPARLGWKPVVQVAHYHLAADVLLQVSGELETGK